MVHTGEDKITFNMAGDDGQFVAWGEVNPSGVDGKFTLIFKGYQKPGEAEVIPGTTESWNTLSGDVSHDEPSPGKVSCSGTVTNTAANWSVDLQFTTHTSAYCSPSG